MTDEEIVDLLAWARQHPDVAPTTFGLIRELVGSRDFYRRRCEALQAYQRFLPEPHRTAVCNILANGSVSPWTTCRICKARPAERPNGLCGDCPDPKEANS